MIVSKEEADKKYLEIVNKTFNCKEVSQLYAKWYAEKVIDRCAEEAIVLRTKEEVIADDKSHAREFRIVDKQSILKVKKEL